MIGNQLLDYSENKENMKTKITVVGIGPGDAGDMTGRAVEAIRQSRVIVGYSYYLSLIRPLAGEGVEIVGTGMRQEAERIDMAFDIALSGRDVTVISSGDANIYGMAPLVMQRLRERSVTDRVEVEIVPGISAFQKAASLLGAPVSHDFCVVSLSDLMTPWGLIERRIKAAVDGDFVTAVYNPRSVGRYWQIWRLKELFLEGRSPSTPVGYVRQAGRQGERTVLTTLSDFDPGDVDMFTVVIIGNSTSFNWEGRIVTPRGYQAGNVDESGRKGEAIMIESFRTIERELVSRDIPLGLKWPLLHAIHTTADFEMERLLRVDEGAVETIFSALTCGADPTIVTDVTMVASGIRKGALERLGIKVECYLNRPETSGIAQREGITRTQAGVRLAVEEHPCALYVFGNAPTALMELCGLMRAGKARPCGVVAAPVGFVHVCESKHMLKPFRDVPKIIVEGRKGGSNLAATLVNSILCWPDARDLKPGRDV